MPTFLKRSLCFLKANFGVQTDGKLTPVEGESASLPCSVIDSGTTDKRNFTFEWSFNDTILQSCNPSGEVFFSVDQTGKYGLHHGKTSCNLTILNLNLKDEGRYQCDVHDAFYNQSNNNSTTIVIACKFSKSLSYLCRLINLDFRVGYCLMTLQ